MQHITPSPGLAAGALAPPAPAASIVELTDISDLARLSDLLGAVWGREEKPHLPLEALVALSHAGHYLAGAFVGERLAAGAVGFLAQRESPRLSLHSHILGVLPDLQAAGLGFAVKQHQRTWALDRDMDTITWTFDPLVRRNAYFNLVKLGAECGEYHIDYYGSMTDAINSDGSTDRVVATWRLRSPRAEAAAAGRSLDAGADVERLRSRDTPVILEVGSGSMPMIASTADADVLLVQVPEDVVALRHQRPELARSWRLAMRETFGERIRAGWMATGMSRSGWYLLTR